MHLTSTLSGGLRLRLVNRFNGTDAREVTLDGRSFVVDLKKADLAQRRWLR